MPANEVHVSPFDLGLTLGFGIFETMAAYEGTVFLFERHFQRLVESAKRLNLTQPEERLILEGIAQVMAENGLTTTRARVRLAISGGENPLTGGDAEGSILITAVAQAEPAKLAHVILSPYTHNEKSALVGVKAASFGANLLAYRHAIEQGADEAVMLNSAGNLCEGTTSNLFLVHGDHVVTPPLESGCLPGVTRGLVLELCQESNIAVETRDLTELDLHDATELFLTSSARGVQPATLHKKEPHCQWTVTARIAAAYDARVKKETQL